MFGAPVLKNNLTKEVFIDESRKRILCPFCRCGCYDLPADRAMTSDEAARLVKWVIDMALGPAASGVLVEPMRNYPPSGKMPLIISVAGVQQHLFWFYPQQPFEEMCEPLSAMLKEIPVTCDSVPA